MPFVEINPWYRKDHKVFQGVSCPDEAMIPIWDAAAWHLYPRHRWVYNKLLICESESLPHGPHGTNPPAYPVFSKPIYNLFGLGMGARLMRGEQEYFNAFNPGHLWMLPLSGTHISTDVALTDGMPRWWRHATGVPGPLGTFRHWTIESEPHPPLERHLKEWALEYLRGFTGIANFETIGGIVIECHLRMTDQWIDLYGPGWLEAAIGLYADGKWHFDERRRQGYSISLFVPHGKRWHIDPEATDALARRPDIVSIDITFDPTLPPEQHASPLGGFRLAIVNCWNLDAGYAVRDELERRFVATDR